MKLIDTHCHLYSKEFDRDREEMIQRAEREGVERFYLPMVDSGSRAALLELEALHPDKCFGMTGLHPCSVKENYAAELRIVEEDLARRPWARWGRSGWISIGIALLNRINTEVFHLQVEWALTTRCRS